MAHDVDPEMMRGVSAAYEGDRSNLLLVFLPCFARQALRVTARSPQSGFNTGAPIELSSKDIAKKRARVIAAHYGTLPRGTEDVIVGAVGTPDARTFIKDHYSVIESEIMTERLARGKSGYK